MKVSLSRPRKGVEKLVLLITLLSPWTLGVTPFAWADVADSSEAQPLVDGKKWAEAAIVLKAELARGPQPNLQVSISLARALIFTGRREEALTVLEQALAAQRSVAARQALIQKIRIFSQVFLTNTGFQLHQDGVNLMMARKYRAAREKFDKALEQEPTNVANLIRLGQCMVLGGDYDSAAERLRLANRLNPYEPEVRLWLGRALHQRGEIAEATDELKSAYDDQPGSEIAAIWYADTLVSIGQRSEALRVLEKDVEQRPDNVGSLVTLAKLRLSGLDPGLSSRLSPKNLQLAWQSRQDLQLALSRLATYLDAASSSAVPMPTAPTSADAAGNSMTAPIAASNDLAVDQRRPEDELKREIEKLMSDADALIKNGT